VSIRGEPGAALPGSSGFQYTDRVIVGDKSYYSLKENGVF
jgi:DNA repair protein RadC